VVGWIKQHHPHLLAGLAIQCGMTAEHWADLHISISRMGCREVHEYVMQVELDDHFMELEPLTPTQVNAWESAVAEIEQHAQEWAREEARRLYRLLEEEHEYLTGAECLSETLEESGIEFDFEDDDEEEDEDEVATLAA
jgi:hypothetical protein